jgi:Immunoglobulin I-set domain/Immunoglobulin domain
MVSFNVAAGGSDPLIFQWFKGGITLVDSPTVVGAQTPMLTLTDVTGLDAGWYTVVISNDFSSVTSTPVLLVVQDPAFATQPFDQDVYAGGTAQFAVRPGGTPPFAYQWRRDGTNLSNGGNISGAGSATLTITSASSADASVYSVVISNQFGSLISSPALLTVIAAPPPGPGILAVVDISQDTGGAGYVDAVPFRFGIFKQIWIFDDLLFTTNDVGRLFTITQLEDPDFSSLAAALRNGSSDAVGYYLWGSGAATTEQNFFSLPPGQIDFQGFPIDNISLYVERLSITHPDGGWTDISFKGKLYVNSEPWGPPNILVPPMAQTAESGSTVAFSVQASSFPVPVYQWRLNGDAMANSTNRVLWLTNVDAPNTGSYCVVITNFFGAVTSPPAVLQVIAPVERRPVPAISLNGDAGSVLNLDYADSLAPANWLPLNTVSLASTSQWYFDVTTPIPPQRFYRAWQTGTPSALPALSLPGMVPALTLAGTIGDRIRVDAINQTGPTDAWLTLDTVTLTNTTQLYFDVTAPGRPPQLYRLVPMP